MIAHWPCPGPRGLTVEYAASFDRSRVRRLLIVPALFDEANRTRRFLVETMRLLDRTGVDSFLPDLPGCNESLQPFAAQTLDTWRGAMAAAGAHFRATEVLALRGGALLVGDELPGWLVEPAKGASLLRQLVRARTIAAREEGREEKLQDLIDCGRSEGLDLAGYQCGAALIGGLEAALPADSTNLRVVSQGELGGSALWLRSEPSEDAAQSVALAGIIAGGGQA